MRCKWCGGPLLEQIDDEPKSISYDMWRNTYLECADCGAVAMLVSVTS